MSKQQHAAPAPHAAVAPPTAPALRSAAAPSRVEPAPRTGKPVDLAAGLRVDLRTLAAGPVELEARTEHRIIVHAGPPVRGACRVQSLHYTRGDVDIFPAGDAESWEAEAPVTSLFLHLSPALLRRAAEELGLDSDRAGLEPRHQLRDPQIEHVAWALDAERRAGYPSGRLYTESLGLGLAAHLVGRYNAPARTQRGLSRPQLRRLAEYIEEHLAEDLSLARLAGVVGVSASHLKTLFKRSTGLPVHEYVLRRRVERAKALLVGGELPASQVAAEAGFAHQSHMARTMRRVLGVTPSALARGGNGNGTAPR